VTGTPLDRRADGARRAMNTADGDKRLYLFLRPFMLLP
jgi:hypothetical protein